MKSKIVITSLIAGTLMLPVAGYAIDRDSTRVQPYPVLMETSRDAEAQGAASVTVKDASKDLAMASQIKFKVGGKVSYKTNIDIDVADGVVFLSGNARNQGEVSLAESIARSVKGVTSVQNTIQITSQATAARR